MLISDQFSPNKVKGIDSAMFIAGQYFSRDYHEISLNFRLHALLTATRGKKEYRFQAVFNRMRAFYSL